MSLLFCDLLHTKRRRPFRLTILFINLSLLIEWRFILKAQYVCFAEAVWCSGRLSWLVWLLTPGGVIWDLYWVSFKMVDRQQSAQNKTHLCLHEVEIFQNVQGGEEIVQTHLMGPSSKFVQPDRRYLSEKVLQRQVALPSIHNPKQRGFGQWPVSVVEKFSNVTHFEIGQNKDQKHLTILPNKELIKMLFLNGEGLAVAYAAYS